MFDRIAKTARYLRREFPRATMLGLAYMGLIALFWAAAPPLALAFFAVATPSLPVYARLLGDRRPWKSRAWVNGVRIEGDWHDVAGARMMQKLIASCTKKLQYTTKLPPRMQRRIDAHLADVAPRLKRLRLSDAKGNPVASLAFTRKVYDVSGKSRRLPVASFAPDALATAPPAAAPAASTMTGLGDALKNAVQNAPATVMPPTAAAHPKDTCNGPKV